MYDHEHLRSTAMTALRLACNAAAAGIRPDQLQTHCAPLLPALMSSHDRPAGYYDAPLSSSVAPLSTLAAILAAALPDAPFDALQAACSDALDIARMIERTAAGERFGQQDAQTDAPAKPRKATPSEPHFATMLAGLGFGATGVSIRTLQARSKPAPEYPATAVDCPDVRWHWHDAHARLAGAREALAHLDADVEVEHRRAQAQALTRGTKARGELRHPVPRDFKATKRRQMEAEALKQLDKAQRDVDDIASGEVIGARVLWEATDGDHHMTRNDDGSWSDQHDPGCDRATTLVRKGDAEEARRRREQQAAWFAEFEARIPELVEECQPSALDLELERRLDEAAGVLPDGREPTARELGAFLARASAAVEFVEQADRFQRNEQHRQVKREARAHAQQEAAARTPEQVAADLAQTKARERDRKRSKRAAETPEQAQARRERDAQAKAAKRGAAKASASA